MTATVKVRLNQWAELVEYSSASPAVLFEGRHYKQRELVPPQIRGDNLADAVVAKGSLSARDFVEMCMTEKFGDSDNWPALARIFAFA